MIQTITQDDYLNHFQITNLEPICKLIIPEFPTQILLSKARRATYYTKENRDSLPKYLLAKVHSKEYSFINKGTKKNSKLILCDNHGTPIIKNKLSVGKPRYATMSGNDFMSGMHPGVRSKMVHTLKNFYKPFIKDLPVFDPSKQLRVFWKLSTVLSGEWDPSNLFFYYKYFEDTLVDEHKLQNDTYQFVKQPGNAPFISPVEKWEERKFEFYFYYNGTT